MAQKKMKKLKKMSFSQLKKELQEAEEKLQALTAEIERRELQRQHDGVDHLDEYLKNATPSFLKLFDIVQKIRKKKNKKK